MKKVIPTQRYKEAATPCDLYFIETQCAERHIKIGIASNIKDRLSTFRTHCPYPLKLLKLVPGAAQREKEIHARFAADRLTGEWFKRSDELLALIDELEGLTEVEPAKHEFDFDEWSRCWHEFFTRTGRYEGLVLEEDEVGA